MTGSSTPPGSSNPHHSRLFVKLVGVGKLVARLLLGGGLTVKNTRPNAKINEQVMLMFTVTIRLLAYTPYHWFHHCASTK
jgi:hypothetical protein